MCGGSVFQGGNNFFQTCIKVKRCLIAEHGIFVKLQHFTEMFNIIDHSPVAAHYTLGYAGGAGSKHNVDGIGVDLTVADRSQSGIINLTCGNLVVVVNPSFARIFYRNAINIGFPIMECAQAAEEIQAGDQVSVDFATGVITDETTGKTYQAAPFPEFINGIIQSGGLLNSLKARGVAK